ncbi:MAG: PaaI family thioesterase [Pyrinomonadaceae bacterium]|nr:PaaI family thioesterase [Pyrinomonadaceae bacterium]
MTSQPLNSCFAKDIKRSFAEQAIMQLIGAELGRIEPGMVEIALSYRTELTQQNGYLHAGVVTAIADSACGYAAYSLMPAGSEVLSVEFKVNLLRPAKGDKFLAHADVIKPGKTLTVVKADVFGVSGEAGDQILVASMLGTMFCIRNVASDDPARE